MHGILRANGRVWPEHYPAGIWRSVWELAYPRPFKAIVDRERQRSPIPEALAYAIMREESAFKPRAVSSSNAYGLMQLIEPTAQRMAAPLGFSATAESLKRPEVNIALGSYSVPGEWGWIWFLLIGPHLVFAHTRAGRILGLDRLLVKRITSQGQERAGLGQLLVRLA